MREVVMRPVRTFASAGAAAALLLGVAGWTGGMAPAARQVPAKFAAESVTFASSREAFVLGTAPCAVAPCTSILRTLDRGRTWRGIPVPAVRIGRPGGPASAVWGIRFASRSRGFVFGSGLWATTDGGDHWHRVPGPGGSILALAAIDG